MTTDTEHISPFGRGWRWLNRFGVLMPLAIGAVLIALVGALGLWHTETNEAGVARLAAEQVKIPRPPGPMKHGGSVIAFIEDPDGYKIELIERS